MNNEKNYVEEPGWYGLTWAQYYEEEERRKKEEKNEEVSE